MASKMANIRAQKGRAADGMPKPHKSLVMEPHNFEFRSAQQQLLL
jgi:hypothetical protein